MTDSINDTCGLKMKIFLIYYAFISGIAKKNILILKLSFTGNPNWENFGTLIMPSLAELQKKYPNFETVIHKKHKFGEIQNFNYLPISHTKLNFNKAG